MGPIAAFLIALIIVLILIGILSFICKTEFAKKRSRPLLNIDDLRNRGKTGDLILFSHHGSYTTYIEKVLEASEFSHVGILYFNSESRTPYVWESITSDPIYDSEVPDSISGKVKPGPQLRNLEEVLKVYKGYIVYCPLVPSFEETLGKEETQKRFQKVIDDHKEKCFDNGYKWILFLCFVYSFRVNVSEETLNWARGKLSRTDTIFCNDLAVKTYEALGMWENVRPKEYMTFYFPDPFTIMVILEIGIGKRSMS
jgi:hypothetical protein